MSKCQMAWLLPGLLTQRKDKDKIIEHLFAYGGYIMPAAGKKNDENMSIEAAFSQIDSRIKELEKEDISLEDSFKYYKEGMELLKYCNDAIDKVEKKVQKISGDGALSDFE